MSRPKVWPTSNLLPSGCQPHNLRKMAHGLPHPAWGCWDAEITFPKGFQGNSGLWSGLALQRCTIHSKMPPQMLCRAVQELCRCLTSMIESGDLVNLKMLDVAKRNPVAPASKGRALSLMPRVEPPVSVTAPSQLTTSEPEEAAPPEELALVPRWETTGTPWLLPVMDRWVQFTPTGAGRLAHEHNPGSPTGFCLIGVHTGDYITFSSDGWGMLWVTVPDCCPNVPDLGTPTIGPAHTPRSTWLWGGALSKHNALYLIYEWLQVGPA